MWISVPLPLQSILWTAIIFLHGLHAQVTSGTSKCTNVKTGQAAFGSWKDDAPGVCRKIVAADMPAAFASTSSANFATVIPRPAGAWPKVLPGFNVSEFAAGLNNSRIVRVAPNGDIFVSEMAAGRIRVLRAADGVSVATSNNIYYSGLNLPHGIAFYPPNNQNPQYVYVANTNSVMRFQYQSGDMVARGAPETIVPLLPSGGDHFTKDIAFSGDGSKMYISVGSNSNYGENRTAPYNETDRAAIYQYNPDGSGYRIYATGIRNAVGIAINPTTGQLWMSTNERDGLGDNLVPDYISHIQDGGFYGWPYYYIGSNTEPRLPTAVFPTLRPDLQNKTIVPDVLLQSHTASLGVSFYTGSAFPSMYVGDAFAGNHGSWNRGNRTGYKVIRVPMVNGIATGEYQDFMTGFVTDAGEVWGRPVGTATAHDGSMLVSDDGSGTIWRISYNATAAAGGGSGSTSSGY